MHRVITLLVAVSCVTASVLAQPVLPKLPMLVDRAQGAMAAGRWGDAIEAWQTVLAQQPWPAEAGIAQERALLGLATSELQLTQFDAASAICQRLLAAHREEAWGAQAEAVLSVIRLAPAGRQGLAADIQTTAARHAWQAETLTAYLGTLADMLGGTAAMQADIAPLLTGDQAVPPAHAVQAAWAEVRRQHGQCREVTGQADTLLAASAQTASAVPMRLCLARAYLDAGDPSAAERVLAGIAATASLHEEVSRTVTVAHERATAMPIRQADLARRLTLTLDDPFIALQAAEQFVRQEAAQSPCDVEWTGAALGAYLRAHPTHPLYVPLALLREDLAAQAGDLRAAYAGVRRLWQDVVGTSDEGRVREALVTTLARAAGPGAAAALARALAHPTAAQADPGLLIRAMREYQRAGDYQGAAAMASQVLQVPQHRDDGIEALYWAALWASCSSQRPQARVWLQAICAAVPDHRRASEARRLVAAGGD